MNIQAALEKMGDYIQEMKVEVQWLTFGFGIVVGLLIASLLHAIISTFML